METRHVVMVMLILLGGMGIMGYFLESREPELIIVGAFFIGISIIMKCLDVIDDTLRDISKNMKDK